MGRAAGPGPSAWVAVDWAVREPFRRVLYPTMLRRIRRAWVAAYGA